MKIRAFLIDFLPFILFAVLYDALRIFKPLAGPIQVILPYHWEKMLFGFTYGGQKIIPTEFFMNHHTPWLDFLTGITYSLHMIVPLGFAFWIRKDRPLARRFAWSFLLVNLFAFATYISFPAAPPWYVELYGLDPGNWSIPASAAGLIRFDELIGSPYFQSVYAKSTWVFGAIPSMHAGFPLLVILFARKVLRKGMIPLSLFMFSVWFSAVYLRHHYIIDLLAGALYVFTTYFLMQKFILRRSLLILAFTLLVTPLHAWSSPNVPIDDPVYHEIDQLVAAGLVPDLIYGQRPWSRSEIARMISAADNREKSAPSNEPVKLLLKKLRHRFPEEQGQPTRFHPLSYLESQYTFLNGEGRPVPDNGLGQVNAQIEPLSAYQEGRRYPDGHQISLETEQDLATRYVSWYARPRFQFDASRNGEGQAKPYIQQLYAKLSNWNVELEAGRDSLEWGQGEFGGILLSNNARPFDMIKISNPSPTHLPWIFQYVGPVRYTLFVANLGPEREFPYSYLTGLKLSFKPVSFFEVGIAQLLVLGGNGAPGPLTVGNVLREFLGSRANAAAAPNLTNRQAGFDGRFYLPFLRNTQLYLEIQFEDSGFADFMLLHLANYLAGVSIPRLDAAGLTSLRLEYHHGSPYFYRHSLFATGMSLNGKIWGDTLGPQADSGTLTFYRNVSERFSLQIPLYYEQRANDVLGPNGTPRTGLVTITPGTTEQRIGGQVQARYSFAATISGTVEYGYERILSFNFNPADDRDAFLGRVGLRFNIPEL